MVQPEYFRPLKLWYDSIVNESLIETAGSTDPQAITKALADKDFDGVTGILNEFWPHTSEISSSHRVLKRTEVSAQSTPLTE